MERIKKAYRIRGEIEVPGDKSISHRALILGSMSSGECEFWNLSRALDVLSTRICLEKLGVRIRREGGRYIVEGKGLTGYREPEDILNAGNSGTTMRILSGLLSAQPFLSIITGDSSLRERPMRRVIEPLRLMGAQIFGRDEGRKAPIVIKGGRLKGINYKMDVSSAQVKSAILIAGLYAEGETLVEEPSKSRDHTERMLRGMGASISFEEKRVRVERTGKLEPISMRIPGDISSASFFIVLSLLHPDASLKIKNVLLNPTRTGIIDVLKKMGGKIEVENKGEEKGEPFGDIYVETSRLSGIEIGGDIIPKVIDEIPLLALAGALSEGETIIKDAEELRYKETDRIRATVEGLRLMGAKIEERRDGMIIEGVDSLKGAMCDSHGDHRMAMTFSIAGLIAEGETEIKGYESVIYSYPKFWEDIKRVAIWR